MVILRDSLRNLLYSADVLPYLHCEVVIQFPLGSQDESPWPTLLLPSLPVDSEAWGAQSVQVAVWTSDSVESCLLVEAFLLRPAEHNVVETGNKNFASRLLGVILNGATPISNPFIPGSMNPGAVRGAAPYIGCWFTSICHLLENLAPALQGIVT